MDNLIDIVKLRREKVMEELYDELLKKFDCYNSVFIYPVDPASMDSYSKTGVKFWVPKLHYRQFIDKIKDKGFIIEYEVFDETKNPCAKVRIDDLS